MAGARWLSHGYPHSYVDRARCLSVFQSLLGCASINSTKKFSALSFFKDIALYLQTSLEGDKSLDLEGLDNEMAWMVGV